MHTGQRGQMGSRSAHDCGCGGMPTGQMLIADGHGDGMPAGRMVASAFGGGPTGEMPTGAMEPDKSSGGMPMGDMLATPSSSTEMPTGAMETGGRGGGMPTGSMLGPGGGGGARTGRARYGALEPATTINAVPVTNPTEAISDGPAGIAARPAAIEIASPNGRKARPAGKKT